MRRKASVAGACCVFLVLYGCANQALARRQELAEPAPWSHWTQVRGGRVHYLDTAPGRSGAAVLIIHGYLGSTVPFFRLVERLHDERRVVMPDLPGCGLSSPPAGAADLEGYLAFLWEFSRQLGLDRVVLVASSLGCQIGAQYELRNAGQVEALVLSSPFGLSGQGDSRLRLARNELLLRLAAPWVSRVRLLRELQKAAVDERLISPEPADPGPAPGCQPDGGQDRLPGAPGTGVASPDATCADPAW